jgi:chaperonin GroEL
VLIPTGATADPYRVTGGDSALLHAAALSSPLYWIATNAGLDGSVVVNKVAQLPAGQGFNAATLTYGDLLADGIVDPVKVTRSAVLNAASVTRMVLTTETAIVEKVSHDEDEHAGHGHGHAH